LTGFVLIGKIISVYGKSGEVKVKLYDEYPEEVFLADFCYVDFFGSKKKLRVNSVKKSGKFLILLFEGFDSEKSNSVLLEKDLYIEQEQTQELPEFSFLIDDLINSTVFVGEELLGKIVDVLSLPGNDVYVVEDVNNKETLVPAIQEIINRFDKQKKKLYLKVDMSYFEDDEN